MGRLLLSLFMAGPPLAGLQDVRASRENGSSASAAQARPAPSALPVHFEANEGQTDPRVRFLARGAGHSLFLTPEGAVLVLAPTGSGPRSVVRMRIAGGNPAAQIVGREPLSGRSHYLLGSDPNNWHTGVPHYARVQYEEVYPGIGVAFYGEAGTIEYDFMVKPGADARRIRLRFDGAKRLRLNGQGDLLIETPAGVMVQRAPAVYTEEHGIRRSVAGRYVLGGRHEVAFAIGDYDRTRRLVIDPVLSYSTYLGGSGGERSRVALDAAGNVYLAGYTSSPDFPTLGSYQADLRGETDAFVAKLDPSGTTLLYSTYLGGQGGDGSYAMAVDASGQVHLTGSTFSADFPRVNAVQPGCDSVWGDAFVAKLNAAGSALVYSTCLGGSVSDTGMAVAADAAGGTLVTGWAKSRDFPVLNAIQPVFGGGHRDGFVTRLSPTGALVYSTYLGGTLEEDGFAILADSAGNAYVAGRTASPNFPMVSPFQGQHAGGLYDGFLAKLNAAGSAFLFSTYFGGSSNDSIEAIALDAAGDIYMAGETGSIDFPTLKPAQPANGGGFVDAFVAKMNAAGSSLLYSTYLGGASSTYVGAVGWDTARGLAVDASGRAWITGFTSSTDFPAVNAIQPAFGGGLVDAFVAKLDATGSTWLYSTYLGGSEDDVSDGVAVDRSARAWVSGFTVSSNFPTVSPLQADLRGGSDAFVSRLSPTSLPATLAVDPSPGSQADGNGVLEAGETVVVAPSWLNDRPVAVTFTGAASHFGGPPGATYGIVDGMAQYGPVGGGMGGSCGVTGDCYALTVSKPPARPAAHWDATVRESVSSGEAKTWTIHVGESFADVPRSHAFYRFVEAVFHRGLSIGCGDSVYCPAAAVSRAQMAVFLLRARHRAGYVPPPPNGAVFSDVPWYGFAAAWIEQLFAEGITSGCGGGKFCPDSPVTRGQMAVLLLRAREGIRFLPPPAQGVFEDVPVQDQFAPWIEELARRGITSGCSSAPLRYCPAAAVTRGQIAVFLTRAFGLRLQGDF